MYSAKAPARLTPMPTVFGHRCWRAGAAVAAVAADDVAFGADPLAEFVAGDAGADLHDAADEFVPDHEARLDRALTPLVPLVDVQVGAADGGLFQLDQDLGWGRSAASAPVPSRCPCRLRA
jgi:hypothetical protein